MARYRANMRFGPWEKDDEFESEDSFHTMLAEEGKMLTSIDEPADSLLGVPVPSAEAFASQTLDTPAGTDQSADLQ